MPQRKLTPSVISMIRPWLDQGLSVAEIAQKIGCTVGSLRVKCSQLKISLRRTEHGGGLSAGDFGVCDGLDEPRGGRSNIATRGRLLVVVSPSSMPPPPKPGCPEGTIPLTSCGDRFYPEVPDLLLSS
jgi:hypothetical protein